MKQTELGAPATTLHSSTGPCPPSCRPSLSGPPVFLIQSCCVTMGSAFLQRATEQCATAPSVLPFYLVPAPLATGPEVGMEQCGSQAWGLLAADIQLRVLDLGLVPREQLSVWHFRGSCHLDWGFSW